MLSAILLLFFWRKNCKILVVIIMEQSDLKVGDIVEVKKQHPCGSKQWKLLRIGVDFKMECVRLWTSDYV
jgi:hypothetical protein